VLLLLVLLPLIYLGLVAGVAWLTWFHATHNLSLLTGRGGGRGRLFVYVTPLVTGALMLIFMIKPILARRAKGPSPIVVRPDQYLFGLDILDEPPSSAPRASWTSSPASTPASSAASRRWPMSSISQ
jgi:hypothetical protein